MFSHAVSPHPGAPGWRLQEAWIRELMVFETLVVLKEQWVAVHPLDRSAAIRAFLARWQRRQVDIRWTRVKVHLGEIRGDVG